MSLYDRSIAITMRIGEAGVGDHPGDVESRDNLRTTWGNFELMAANR